MEGNRQTDTDRWRPRDLRGKAIRVPKEKSAYIAGNSQRKTQREWDLTEVFSIISRKYAKISIL